MRPVPSFLRLGSIIRRGYLAPSIVCITLQGRDWESPAGATAVLFGTYSLAVSLWIDMPNIRHWDFGARGISG